MGIFVKRWPQEHKQQELNSRCRRLPTAGTGSFPGALRLVTQVLPSGDGAVTRYSEHDVCSSKNSTVTSDVFQRHSPWSHSFSPSDTLSLLKLRYPGTFPIPGHAIFFNNTLHGLVLLFSSHDLSLITSNHSVFIAMLAWSCFCCFVKHSLVSIEHFGWEDTNQNYRHGGSAAGWRHLLSDRYVGRTFKPYL